MHPGHLVYTTGLPKSQMLGRYFHAYRIDHVLGFFRIWEIPADGTTGLLGHFRPSIPINRSELESSGIWDIDRCRALLQLLEHPFRRHNMCAQAEADTVVCMCDVRAHDPSIKVHSTLMLGSWSSHSL